MRTLIILFGAIAAAQAHRLANSDTKLGDAAPHPLQALRRAKDDTKRDGVASLASVTSEHDAVLGSQLPGEGQAPSGSLEEQSPTEVTHTSWFERLGDAVWAVLIGLFMVIPFSIALLWLNERRAAQLETLLGAGALEAETIEAANTDLSEYDGTLVHLDSGEVKGVEPVHDARFPDIKLETGCIKLKTSVEVYQWIEEEKSETKKDSVGGGTTTRKTYHYSKTWSSRRVDSTRFRESRGHVNECKVEDLEPGTQEAVNQLVKYGEQYRLGQGLVDQLNNFEDAHKLVGNTLVHSSHSYQSSPTFNRDHGDGYYYYPKHQGGPGIGDFRVKVEYIVDGPASILALQMKDKGGDRTFGPYRTVNQPICGGTSEVELKKRRLAAAKMTPDEIYQEEKCFDFGPFCCLCCCCNLVAMLFSVAPPQIYSVWPGQKCKAVCFSNVRMSAAVSKWGLRLFAWLLLWIGFNMLFEPLSVILDIIPFLGPYLGSGLSWMISVFTFLLTMAIASLVVSAAYLIYRPLIGVIYLGLTVGVIYLIHALGQVGTVPGPVTPALAM